MSEVEIPRSLETSRPTRRSHKKPTETEGNENEPADSKHQYKHLTMVMAASAGGNALPPVYILPLKKYVRATDLDDAVVGSGITHTEKGFMTGQSFHDWLKFLHEHTPASPRLLLASDSSVHMTKEAVDFATANGTHIVLFDSEAADIISPLDQCVLSSFRDSFAENMKNNFPQGTR